MDRSRPAPRHPTLERGWRSRGQPGRRPRPQPRPGRFETNAEQTTGSRRGIGLSRRARGGQWGYEDGGRPGPTARRGEHPGEAPRRPQLGDHKHIRDRGLRGTRICGGRLGPSCLKQCRAPRSPEVFPIVFRTSHVRPHTATGVVVTRLV